MAMGNYDSTVLDHKNKPNEGYFTSPMGVEVEVYKNWLYIHDKKAWRKNDSAFSEDVVLQVLDGEQRYQDINIFTKRYKDGTQLFVVWSGYDKEERGIIGISTLVGKLNSKKIERLQKQLTAWNNATYLMMPDFVSKLRVEKFREFNQGTRYFLQHGIDLNKITKE